MWLMSDSERNHFFSLSPLLLPPTSRPIHPGKVRGRFLSRSNKVKVEGRLELYQSNITNEVMIKDNTGSGIVSKISTVEETKIVRLSEGDGF